MQFLGINGLSVGTCGLAQSRLAGGLAQSVSGTNGLAILQAFLGRYSLPVQPNSGHAWNSNRPGLPR
eukprot:scaffold51196_cov20-Tisochrysis_lutea.AAC.3